MSRAVELVLTSDISMLGNLKGFEVIRTLAAVYRRKPERVRPLEAK